MTSSSPCRLSGAVLAIETSCDETAVAVADADGRILISRIASQIALHAPYGGVVPELASRNHNLDLRPLIASTLSELGMSWQDIALIAATSGPGLASSLLIGDTTAKAIALALEIPFYSINHMEGHLLSPFIGRETSIPPHLGLIVSGGHTLLIQVDGVGDYRCLGSTLDDAAGEAFDKAGKLLGLPYPGGPEIARCAEQGNREAYAFPRSMIDSGNHDFSFSGLKTSIRYTLDKMRDGVSEAARNDLCASFQEAVVETLVSKLFSAAATTPLETLTISGGVSCNRRLRELASEQAQRSGKTLLLAPPDYSTDNAGMIAFAAFLRHRAGILPSPLDADIDPNRRLASVN